MPDRPDERHIFIVNDAAGGLAPFVDAVAAAGYRVTVDEATRSVADLHAAVKSEQPELVIVVGVADGDVVGWHVVHQLKGDPATARIRAVACLPEAGPAEAERHRLATLGVGVVQTPVDLEALLAAGTALGSSSRRRSRGKAGDPS